MSRSKIVGISLILISLLGILSWEFVGRNSLKSDEIIVLKESLPKGEILKANNIVRRKVEEKYEGALIYEDLGNLKNLVAKQVIHKNAPLFPDYFEKKTSKEIKNQIIMQLPEKSIEACPSEMKKGSIALIYVNGKLLSKFKVWRISSRDKKIELIASKEEVDKLTSSIAVGHNLLIGWQR